MKKIRAYVFLMMLLVSGTVLLHADQETEDEIQTSLQKIAEINLRCFPWQEEDWDTDTFKEYLDHHEKRRFTPLPRLKRQSAFALFQAVESKHEQKASLMVINDSQTWEDLNLFCGKINRKKSVAAVLDRTQTEFGKISLCWLLAEPTVDVTVLTQRQKLIKILLDDKKLMEEIDELFVTLQENENILLSFWIHDALYNTAQNFSFFSNSFLASLNNYDSALLIKNLFDHQMRIWGTVTEVCAAAVLLSYGFFMLVNEQGVPDKLKQWAQEYRGEGGPLLNSITHFFENRWTHALLAIAAGTFCALRVPEDYTWMNDMFAFEKLVHRIMHQIAHGFTTLKLLAARVKSHPVLVCHDEFKPLIELFDEKSVHQEKMKKLLGYFQTDTLQQSVSVFSNKGVVMAAYGLMHELKEYFESVLVAAGRLDAYLSCAKLYQEGQDRHVSFCFAVYEQAEKPLIKAHDFWHPILDANNVVVNSIVLGADHERQNRIITGPNEGGKSTILKAVTLCIILAQTIGIVPALTFTLTPFTSISTYLNITDDIGSGNSLFKAEVLRTQALIERMKQLKSLEFNFVVFDEIFNGTSPREGEAAAYSVAKLLGTFSNSIALVATHFQLLTKLEQVTDVFSNVKVSVEHQVDGSIRYPYKLEPGISQQHVAIDILRNQGFSNVVLDEAYALVRKRTL